MIVPPCAFAAVGRFLEERGASAMLEDPLMEIATAEIIAGDRPR